jgi:hypothetical protein
MSDTRIDIYKDWEICITCNQEPPSNWRKAGASRVSGFAYVRPLAPARYGKWSRPFLVPRRGMLDYGDVDEAFAALKTAVRQRIDQLADHLA